MSQNPALAGSMVTEVVPLADWERAFAATRSGTGMKYLLDPREGT